MGQKQFPASCIYVLLDGIDWHQLAGRESDQIDTAAAMASQFATTIQSLATAGVDFIQLRDKQLSDRQIITAGRLARDLLSNHDTRLVINDRPDLAIASGADGVHVGQDELPVRTVRRIVGTDMLIGVSTHSVDQAVEAAAAGADYIGIGPTFPSSTKSFHQHVGPDLVRQVIQTTKLPAFAIGGIDLENASQISASGCQRVAVSGIYRDLIGKPPEAFLRTTEALRQTLSSHQLTSQ